MKLNLKMIAIAAALVASGGAHADLVSGADGNGSFAVYAFNIDTKAYYIRDLGVVMQDFLPSAATVGAGEAFGAAPTFVTPSTGYNLTSANPSGAGSFTTWLTGQDTTKIRWAAVATDGQSNDSTDLARFITTSTAVNPSATNGQVDGAATTLDGLATLFGTNTLVKTGTNFGILSNGGLPTTLSTLGSSAGLYYFTRTTDAGALSTQATRVRYGNADNFATVSLNTAGVFTYDLAPVSAVPVPAAAWLMGSGLLAIGGMVRRRKAAAKA